MALKGLSNLVLHQYFVGSYRSLKMDCERCPYQWGRSVIDQAVNFIFVIKFSIWKKKIEIHVKTWYVMVLLRLYIVSKVLSTIPIAWLSWLSLMNIQLIAFVCRMLHDLHQRCSSNIIQTCQKLFQDDLLIHPNLRWKVNRDIIEGHLIKGETKWSLIFVVELVDC